MEERLLLDRITLRTSDIAVWDAQLPFLVETNPANPVSPGSNETAVSARNATNPLSLSPPQRTNRRVATEHIGQGSDRRVPLRC